MRIEAENQELVIQNEHGDTVVVPADKRSWVMRKLRRGAHKSIDSLVETLPVASDYAQDGTQVPPQQPKQPPIDYNKLVTTPKNGQQPAGGIDYNNIVTAPTQPVKKNASTDSSAGGSPSNVPIREPTPPPGFGAGDTDQTGQQPQLQPFYPWQQPQGQIGTGPPPPLPNQPQGTPTTVIPQGLAAPEKDFTKLTLTPPSPWQQPGKDNLIPETPMAANQTYQESVDYITRDMQANMGLSAVRPTPATGADAAIAPAQASQLPQGVSTNLKDFNPADAAVATVINKPDPLRKYTNQRMIDIDAERARILKDKTDYVQANTPADGYMDPNDPKVVAFNNQLKFLDTQKTNLGVARQNLSLQSVPQEELDKGKPADPLEVGKRILQINDPSYSDDLSAMEKAQAQVKQLDSHLEHTNADRQARADAELQMETVQHKFYQTGNLALSNYYAIQSTNQFDAARPDIQNYNALKQQQDAATTPQQKQAVQQHINDLVNSSDILKSYLFNSQQALNYKDAADHSDEKYPQIRRSNIRQALNQKYPEYVALQDRIVTTGMAGGFAIDPRAFWHWLVGAQAGDEESIKWLANAFPNIPEEEIRSIANEEVKGFVTSHPGGIGESGFAMGIAKDIDQTLAGTTMGLRQLLNLQDANYKNRLLAGREAQYQFEPNADQLRDETGKYNINPMSIFNMMGHTVGMVATYSLPSLVTGGLAAPGTLMARGLEASAAVASMYPSEYEEGYKIAEPVTADETKRRQFANSYAISHAAPMALLTQADVLKKIGGGGSSSIFNRTVDRFGLDVKGPIATGFYKTPGLGAEGGDAFQEFMDNVNRYGPMKTTREKWLSALGQGAEVETMMNLQAQLSLAGDENARRNILGPDLDLYYTMHNIKPPGYAEQAQQTAIMATINALPLAVGAGIGSRNDLSGIRKEAIFSAGNEPDLYRYVVNDLYEKGAIDKSQFEEKIKIINTLQPIVTSVNRLMRRNGKPLSVDEKQEIVAQQYRLAVNKAAKGRTVAADDAEIVNDNETATTIQRLLLGYPVDGDKVSPDTKAEATNVLNKKGQRLLTNIQANTTMQAATDDPAQKNNLQQQIDEDKKDLAVTNQQLDQMKPEGTPVYGPANSLIGVFNNGVFTPNQVALNQADRDLLNNPDELNKYLQSKGMQVKPVGGEAAGGGEIKPEGGVVPETQPLSPDEETRLKALWKKNFNKEQLSNDEINEFNTLQTRSVNTRRNNELNNLFQPVITGFNQMEQVPEHEASGIGFRSGDYEVIIAKKGNTLMVRKADPDGVYQPVYTKEHASQQDAINDFENTYGKEIRDNINQKYDQRLQDTLIGGGGEVKPGEPSEPVNPVISAGPETQPQGQGAGKQLQPYEPVLNRPLSNDENANLINAKVGSNIQKKFDAAPKWISKEKATIKKGNTYVTGHYVMAPWESVTPSHDATNDFKSSPGYPVDEKGKNVNSRGYTTDEEKNFTRTIANGYDQSALDEFPTIDPVGVVKDGNGRAAGAQLAIHNTTEGNNPMQPYNDEFQKRLAGGLVPGGPTMDDYNHVAKGGTPGLFFMEDKVQPYSVQQYDQFNQQDTKMSGEVDEAVKLGRLISDPLYNEIAGLIEGHDNLGKFYNSPDAAAVFQKFVDAKIIPRGNLPQFVNATTGKLTPIGKNRLELALVGKLLDAKTLEHLNDDGMLNYRQKIVRALPELTALQKTPEYSLHVALNQAIHLLNGFRSDDTAESLKDYLENEKTDHDPNRTVEGMMMAIALNGKETQFKKEIAAYKDAVDAAHESGGEAFGDAAPLPEQQQLLQKALNIKDEQLKSFQEAAAANKDREPGADTGIPGQPAGSVTATKTAVVQGGTAGQTGENAPAAKVTTRVTATLPRDLANAKPKYGYKNNLYDLDFENDLDKAAYITAQTKPSKRDADYLKFVADKTGLSEDEVRAHGQKVRNFIKGKAAIGDAEEGVIHVPDQQIKAKGQATETTTGAKVIPLHSATKTVKPGDWGDRFATKEKIIPAIEELEPDLMARSKVTQQLEKSGKIRKLKGRANATKANLGRWTLQELQDIYNALAANKIISSGDETTTQQETPGGVKPVTPEETGTPATTTPETGKGTKEKTVAELQAIPFDQRTDQEHADFIRGKLKQEFSNVPADQMDAAIALLDARAAVENPDNPDAYYRKIEDVGNGEFQTGVKKQQGAKGALELLDNGRVIIHALENHNVTTAVHELFHVFEDELPDNEKAVVAHWAGQTDFKPGDEWNKKTSEAWAKAGEDYVHTGKAPTPELQSIFDKFKKWLNLIYSRLIGKKISPEVKEVLDNLFKPKGERTDVRTPEPETPTEPITGGGTRGPPAYDKQVDDLVSGMFNDLKGKVKFQTEVSPETATRLSGKGYTVNNKTKEITTPDGDVIDLDHIRDYYDNDGLVSEGNPLGNMSDADLKNILTYYRGTARKEGIGGRVKFQEPADPLENLLRQAGDILKRGNTPENKEAALEFLRHNWPDKDFPEDFFRQRFGIPKGAGPKAGGAPPKQPPGGPDYTDSAANGGEGTEYIPGVTGYQMQTGKQVESLFKGTMGGVLERPEGELADLNYMNMTVKSMLEDGQNMLTAAKAHYGSDDVLDYGPKLFAHIRQIKGNDLNPKTGVLMGTFLAELQRDRLMAIKAARKNPGDAELAQRSQDINDFEQQFLKYFQDYMTARGQEIASIRMLRLYRDKNLADLFGHLIAADKERREQQKLTRIAAQQPEGMPGDMIAKDEEQAPDTTPQQKARADAEAQKKYDIAKKVEEAKAGGAEVKTPSTRKERKAKEKETKATAQSADADLTKKGIDETKSGRSLKDIINDAKEKSKGKKC